MFFRYEGNERPSDEFNTNGYRWVKNIFDAPELVEGDQKLNVTINYLEDMLSIIELRIKKVDKGN